MVADDDNADGYEYGDDGIPDVLGAVPGTPQTAGVGGSQSAVMSTKTVLEARNWRPCDCVWTLMQGDDGARLHTVSKTLSVDTFRIHKV